MDGLKERRRRSGITQSEIARKLGVTQGAVSQWELGATDPEIRYLLPLAEILGCTVEELLRPEARSTGPTDDGMTFGKKLKALRKDRGLTLQDVGDRVGVGRSTVRKWETGEIANVRRDKIDRIAEALHADPAYLMGWTEGPEARDPGTTERRQTMEGYPTTVLNLTPLSVTTEDAAKITGISTKTLRALIRRGAFPSVHIGRKIVIPTAAIERWLDEHIGERVEAGDEDW